MAEEALGNLIEVTGLWPGTLELGPKDLIQAIRKKKYVRIKKSKHWALHRRATRRTLRASHATNRK